MSHLEVNPAAEASLTGASAPVLRPEHAEGEFARLIEQQTAKIPSHWFLFAALGSMGLSLALELSGRTRASRFRQPVADAAADCGHLQQAGEDARDALKFDRPPFRSAPARGLKPGSDDRLGPPAVDVGFICT